MAIFALSGLINGLIALGLGVFVISSNWKSKVNQLYFLIVAAIAIWSVGYWQWMSSTNADSALFWVRILSIGSTLIPVFYFHWIVSLLKIEEQEKNAVKLVYFVTGLFLIFSFSDIFIRGVEQKSFFSFWPNPGILYHFYIVFTYILLVIYAAFLLLKHFRISPKEKRAQIIYVLIGSSIAFGGGITNFFLWYNIPIPPYGNFLVALYPFFYGYAIIKHHLFDIKVVATELLVFILWIFLLVKTALSETYQDIIINGGLLIAVVIVGILLIKGVLKEVRQREEMEKLAVKIKKAYVVEKKARKELERLDSAKTQFIMATQHHLRTPLTSMVGYLDLIFGGTYGRIPVKLKDSLVKFKVSTNRLIRIVNEFLDISQFQLGKKVVSVQPGTEIEPILDEIIEELGFEAKHKGIGLKLVKPEGHLTANADSGKLKVALYNLVDNAIKYTNKGGVTISVKNKTSLRIMIKDTGIGMTPEELKNVFHKTFERGKEAKQVFATGRGIGLFITSQIIKAHNGKVWVESQGRGKGSTSYVQLPIK